MTVRVDINDFGRMGRLGLRVGWGREVLSIVRVNEIATDAAGLRGRPASHAGGVQRLLHESRGG